MSDQYNHTLLSSPRFQAAQRTAHRTGEAFHNMEHFMPRVNLTWLGVLLGTIAVAVVAFVLR